MALQNKIVALLPAHNEAESIATTLRALAAQTRVPDQVIVICDNCTDATAGIAAAHGITAGNPFLHLKTLRAGEKIYVTTRYATYTYVVTGEHVVRYTGTSVLAPVPGSPGATPTSAHITLITCTPVTLLFTPWRVIVTGVLTATQPR
jgi:LPXTG-site transpeptidase (sortase) family protein